MLDNIPYIFIFSVVAIANEFLIQNMLVNIIINITTPATVYIIVTVLSSNAKASHLKSSVFISKFSYFNSSKFFNLLKSS